MKNESKTGEMVDILEYCSEQLPMAANNEKVCIPIVFINHFLCI